MKIIALGGSGLVGSRFIELSNCRSSISSPTHSDLDLTNPKQVEDFLKSSSPDFVINFAAYTNVGEGEKQRGDQNGDCWSLNVTAVENILNSLDPKTHVIQISTDMVFPGNSADPGPYNESHSPETDSSKVVWYGYTKAVAEEKVKTRTGPWTIVRPIYPVRAKFDKKLDFLRKPLKLYDEGKLYPLFTDQQISISFIDEICTVLDQLIDGKHEGIFHVSSTNLTTPFEIVSYLLEKARGATGVVKESSLKEFLKTVDSPVRYPEYGGLKAVQTQEKLGIKFSTWQKIVDRLVEQSITS